MLIKVLLIAGLLAVGVVFIRRRSAMRFQAGKKILFAGFVVFSCIAVVQPQLTTDIAELVGVGRGADLLLYLLVLAFLFVAVNVYVTFKDYQAQLTRLARRLALHEATAKYLQDDDAT